MQTITALYLITTTALADLRDRLADDDGQTSIEWLGIAAVIVAIIGFMVSGPASTMASTIGSTFESLVESVLG